MFADELLVDVLCRKDLESLLLIRFSSVLTERVDCLGLEILEPGMEPGSPRQ